MINKYLLRIGKALYIELFGLLNGIVFSIPLHVIRKIYMKMILLKVGKKCVFRRNIRLYKPKNIILGNDVMINRNVMLDGRKGLEIGDSVDIGEYSVIWSLEHDPNDNNFNVKGGKVVIEDHVWITPRCIILPGITIGRGAVIATGSVVSKDIPSLSIVAGNPAKIVGKRKNNLDYTFNNIQIF